MPVTRTDETFANEASARATPGRRTSMDGISPSALELTWEMRADGASVYQSPEWYRYAGEAEGSTPAEGWLRSCHPDDRDYLRREWRASLESRGERVYDVTVRLRRHDGIYRWFRLRGTPVFTDDGAVLKWVGTCTEVHDRVQDEEQGRAVRVPARATILQNLGSGQLQRRLFLVVLAGLLPVALLSSVILVRNASDQKRVRLESASDTMLAVLTAVDGELSTITASLQTLAASPRLASGDLAGFDVEARKAIGLRPGLFNIVLSRPDGAQVLNARVPYGAPLPAPVDVESVLETVRTRRPVIGSIVVANVAKTHVFAIRVPVVRDGRVEYVLNAGVIPDAIQDVLARQRIPENGVVTIVDSRHHIVARSANPAQWIGQPASPSLVAMLERPATSGVGLSNTLEGTLVYAVFHKSTLSGWSAAAGIPAEAIDGPVRRAYAALALSTALSILLGLVAAKLVARGITRSMRELELAAIEVGSGRAPVVPRTDLPAVRAAGDALYAAHVEREKLLRSEREARENAERANRAKDEFLAMLGHELRNPLNAIVTSAELLQRSDDPQVIAQAKAIVSRQALHLGRLTDDLLDAGRVMLGKIALARAPLDFARAVAEQLSTLNRTGQLMHHRIVRDLQPVWVLADATRMQQVIGNLVANAIKFTPAGGTVTVSLNREGGQAVLRVADTGVGLDPDLVPRVFDLFVQGETKADRARGGLGIGLTLVRRLAELHGGTAEARSEGRGRGSEFTVRLPAIEAPAAASESVAGAVRAGRRSVVIVEDNDDARMTLRHLLELEGHDVGEAADGHGGIETILQVQPDVALVDIGLPGLDGYALAREVRRRATRPVRLIALTGYGARPGDADAALFDAYVVKPLDPKQLRQLMAQAEA